MDTLTRRTGLATAIVVTFVACWASLHGAERAQRGAPVDAKNGLPQTLTYDVFQVSKDGTRTPLGQSIRQYRPGNDVRVETLRNGAKTKRVSLDHDLALAVDVYREPRLEGFGLSVHKEKGAPGFSWEWFDREKDDVFRKRQGTGSVRVTFANDTEVQELVAVEFLDDITLRSLDFETGNRLEIVVRKGSVFRVRPD
jgi:hypothetical protein